MTTATDNRRRILDMLAEGKITAAEAERVLALIEAPPLAPAFSYDYASDEDSERDGDTGFEAEVEHESHHETATATAEPPPSGSTRASEEHVFTVGSAPRLTIKSFNGRIGLRAGKDGEVHVAAKIRNPSRVGYRAWQEGDNIFVEAHRSKGFSLIPRPAGASIFITAPADSTIDLATSNGRIEVQGICGSGPVRTSNGRIVMENVRGDHEVHTSNGRIVIDGNGRRRRRQDIQRLHKHQAHTRRSQGGVPATAPSHLRANCLKAASIGSRHPTAASKCGCKANRTRA